MKLFGFTLTRDSKDSKKTKEVEQDEELPSIATPIDSDGSFVISSASSGFDVHTLDVSTMQSDENFLIQRWRTAAAVPEAEQAITYIVDAAIVSDTSGPPVTLDISGKGFGDKVNKAVSEEFKSVLSLFKFNAYGHDIFRRWYIDGKLYFHMVVDSEKQNEGIKRIDLLEPTNIKKVKEVETKKQKGSDVVTKHIKNEYYLYSEGGIAQGRSGLKLSPDSVIYVPSGITSPDGKYAVSHLNKSVKIINQLQRVEDALVVYRLSRAPERRIFYIDVGNLPTGKAEAYVQGIRNKYKNKMVYDASTGQLKDSQNHMSMLEDFWLPRKEGGRGTQIETLPGGSNLGDIDDILFFQKKLYKSLNVPSGRLEQDAQYAVGTATEMLRDEVRFQKFVNRLRQKFSEIFMQSLKVQCILKGIVTEEDWNEMVENIRIDFREDSYFSEMKRFELIRQRGEVMDSMQELIGKYYSKAWARREILGITDEEHEKMQKEIEEEKKNEPDDDDGF